MATASEVIIKILGQLDPSVKQSAEATQKAVDDLQRASAAAGSTMSGGMRKSASAALDLVKSYESAGGASKNWARGVTADGEDYIALLNRMKKAQAEAKQAGEDFFGKVGSLAAGAGLAMGAFGASTLALVRSWVMAAGTMEQYTAKLETVKKSAVLAAESVNYAVKLAATTPFEVKGVVDATVQLEVYHASAKQTLPLVADLAAGMGKSIEETALTVGKAWSGSAEGFESLRSSYGLSIPDLKRFGGAVDEQGQIMLKSQEQIDKNRQALMRYVQGNFAGAVERQSKTLMGTLSNMSDAFSRVAAQLGAALLPAFTVVAKNITTLVEKFEALGPGWKAFIAYGTLAAGVAASFGAFLLGAGAVLIGVASSVLNVAAAYQKFQAATKLAALAQTAFTAGAGGSTIATVGLTTATGALNTALLALLANPVVLAIAGIAIAAGGAAYAIYNWEQKELSAQRAMQQQSQLIQQVRGTWHGYVSVLNEAGKAQGIVVKDSNNAAEAINNVKAALAGMSKINLASQLKKQGYTGDQIKKDLENAQSGSERSRSLLGDARAVQQVPLENHQVTGKLQEYLGKSTVSHQELLAVIKQLQNETSTYEKMVGSLGGMYEAILDPIAAAFDNIDNKVQSTKDFLDFSDKVGTVQAYADKVNVLRSTISQVAGELSKLGLPTSKEGALQYLLTGDNEDAKKRIKEYLNLLHDLDASEKEQTAKLREDKQKRIDTIKKNLDNEAALHTVSIHQRVEAQRAINAIAKGDAELEKQAAHDWNVVVKQKRTEEAKDARDSIEDRINIGKDYLKRLAGQNQLTSAEHAKGLRRILADLKKFKADHAAMLKDPANKDLSKWLDNQTRDTKTEAGTEDRKSYEDNYKQVKQTNDNFLAEKEAGSKRSTSSQIADINTVLGHYREAIRTGSIMEKDAHAEMVSLRRRRQQLEQQMFDEAIQNQTALNTARSQALASQLDGLKEEAASGRQINVEIQDNLRQQLALKLANIDLATKKELHVEGLTQDEITRIHATANASRLDALRAHKKALEDILSEQKRSLKDVEDRVNHIKQLAGQEEEKPKDDTLPKFGAESKAGDDRRDAKRVMQLLNPTFKHDRSSKDELNALLGKSGLGILNTGNDKADNAMSGLAKDQGGNTLLSMGDLREKFGLPKQAGGDPIAIGQSIMELDGAIKKLETELTSGLSTQIGNLGTQIGTLATAVATLGGKTPQPSAPAATTPAPGTTTAATSTPGASTQPPTTQAAAATAAAVAPSLPTMTQPTEYGGINKPLPAGYTTRVAPTVPAAAGAAKGGSSVENHFNIDTAGMSSSPDVQGALVALADKVKRRWDSSFSSR